MKFICNHNNRECCPFKMSIMCVSKFHHKIEKKKHNYYFFSRLSTHIQISLINIKFCRFNSKLKASDNCHHTYTIHTCGWQQLYVYAIFRLTTKKKITISRYVTSINQLKWVFALHKSHVYGVYFMEFCMIAGCPCPFSFFESTLKLFK